MARWNREELLLALGLYFETPFGKQHKTHPPIVQLAIAIDRTASAVAMKLSNFTSIDPSELERGIKGLSGASKLDREIWEEYQSQKEHLINEIEALRERHFADREADEKLNMLWTPSGPTTKQVLTQQRRHQSFFRRAVLGSYGGRCCITGNPVPELLRASHIVPWGESEEHRLNPENGLCLSATFDAAFDRGLITVGDDYRLQLGAKLNQYASASEEIKSQFTSRHGMLIELPEKNLPDPKLLRWHSKNIFLH